MFAFFECTNQRERKEAIRSLSLVQKPDFPPSLIGLESAISWIFTKLSGSSPNFHQDLSSGSSDQNAATCDTWRKEITWCHDPGPPLFPFFLLLPPFLMELLCVGGNNRGSCRPPPLLQSQGIATWSTWKEPTKVSLFDLHEILHWEKWTLRSSLFGAGISVLTLNRKEGKNSLSRNMLAQFREGIEDLRFNPYGSPFASLNPVGCGPPLTSVDWIEIERPGLWL